MKVELGMRTADHSAYPLLQNRACEFHLTRLLSL